MVKTQISTELRALFKRDFKALRQAFPGLKNTMEVASEDLGMGNAFKAVSSQPIV
jgi:hypothetical protein